jgi:hypothetical protein
LPNQQKQENGFMTEWTMVLFILKTGNIDENITHLKKTKILEIFIFLQEICTERRRILMHSGFKKYMQKMYKSGNKGNRFSCVTEQQFNLR